MKRILHFGLPLVALVVMGSCTTESITDQLIDSKPFDSTSILTNGESQTPEASEEEVCFSTTLVAGQHYASGIVSLSVEDGMLRITYSMNADWTIGTTHLSVGDCGDDWVPLNGGGNPKIGQFEFTEPVSATATEVVYEISLDGLGETICFAAHAEVEGPTGGETAWAEGTQFDGNGWAMYVQTGISECEGGTGGNPGGVF